MYKEDCAILRICSDVRACSPEQYFQLSSANTTQTIGLRRRKCFLMSGRMTQNLFIFTGMKQVSFKAYI